MALQRAFPERRNIHHLYSVIASHQSGHVHGLGDLFRVVLPKSRVIRDLALGADLAHGPGVIGLFWPLAGPIGSPGGAKEPIDLGRGIAGSLQA